MSSINRHHEGYYAVDGMDTIDFEAATGCLQTFSGQLRTLQKRYSILLHFCFLWWVSTINNKRMYYASGSGGHRIMIFPDNDMIMVHRVNTYENSQVSEQEINKIATRVFDAQKGLVTNNSAPSLIAYRPDRKSFTNIYSGSMDQYLGTYKRRFLGEMTIKKNPQGYILKNGVGTFKLYTASENSFYPEDLESLMQMKKATEDDKMFTIEPKFDKNGSMISVIFYY